MKKRTKFHQKNIIQIQIPDDGYVVNNISKKCVKHYI
jgi:hypothetical protein